MEPSELAARTRLASVQATWDRDKEAANELHELLCLDCYDQAWLRRMANSVQDDVDAALRP